MPSNAAAAMPNCPHTRARIDSTDGLGATICPDCGRTIRNAKLAAMREAQAQRRAARALRQKVRPAPTPPDAGPASDPDVVEEAEPRD